ncbi:unnamed protein product [Camellia sinensis]
MGKLSAAGDCLDLHPGEQFCTPFHFIAMAMGDDVMGGAGCSFFLDSVESKQGGDALSPEDVAWADSCLIKDSEISDGNWDSLKAALLNCLDITTSQHDSLGFSAAGSDGFTGGTDFESLPSIEEAQTPPNLGRTVDNDDDNDDDDDVLHNEVEENSDDYIVLNKVDKLKSRTKLGNPFLPNYSEDVKEIENTDLGLDLGFPVFERESLGADIFRVWDLDIPDEEDGELVKQLNKALVESSVRSMPSLDDLIAGISDLSLNQYSG